jgi:hypothetical protein
MTSWRPWAEPAVTIETEPVRRLRLAEYDRAIGDVRALTALRAELGLPGHGLGEELDGLEPRVAHHEGDEGWYVAALRDFVAALGGRLEINAVFQDGTLTLLPGRRWVVPAADDHERSGAARNRTAASGADAETAPVGVAVLSRRRNRRAGRRSPSAVRPARR